MHRLYFLMPDVTVTHALVNELLLSHVAESHIHVIAQEGTPMEELPEASLLQKSDFIPAVERGLTLGAVTGVMVGLVAMTFPPAGLAIGGGALFAIGAAGADGQEYIALLTHSLHIPGEDLIEAIVIRHTANVRGV